MRGRPWASRVGDDAEVLAARDTRSGGRGRGGFVLPTGAGGPGDVAPSIKGAETFADDALIHVIDTESSTSGLVPPWWRPGHRAARVEEREAGAMPAIEGSAGEAVWRRGVHPSAERAAVRSAVLTCSSSATPGR